MAERFGLKSGVRCYFLRDNKIEAAYLLTRGSDADLVREARDLFEKHASDGMQGFEVWDGVRFVYREAKTERPTGAAAEGRAT